DQIGISVRDTAGGMSPEVEQYATDWFFTTKANHAHGGLGLPMARDLVRANSGDLRILNEPGEGVEVCMLLPRAMHPLTQDVPSQSETALERPFDTHQPLAANILLVDDEPILRRSTAGYLKLHGAKVITEAATAAAATEAINEAEDFFDAIILDMKLPDRS